MYKCYATAIAQGAEEMKNTVGQWDGHISVAYKGTNHDVGWR